MNTDDTLITQLREQVNALLSQIKQLDEPDRTMLLREARARFAASIDSPARSQASRDNMTKLNEARQAYGVSDETRAKLSAARKAAWERKQAEQVKK